MDKFTLANLKETLSQKTKDELIQEISTLYENFSQVKDYYKAQGSDTKKVVKRYKDIIEKDYNRK